eukprot:3523756-Heterocapsa_arctica.AAC.1
MSAAVGAAPGGSSQRTGSRCVRASSFHVKAPCSESTVDSFATNVTIVPGGGTTARSRGPHSLCHS